MVRQLFLATLFYAYFAKLMEKNVHFIYHLIQEYGQNYGQYINRIKYKFYDGGTYESRLRHVVDMLGFIVDHASFNYIGVPIFKCKPRTHHHHHQIILKLLKIF